MRTFETLHAGGHTVIMVTHDPLVAERAGRLIQIADGQVVS
jgi:macrolide transport system ATP-binding/permease protein